MISMVMVTIMVMVMVMVTIMIRPIGQWPLAGGVDQRWECQMQKSKNATQCNELQLNIQRVQCT